MVHLLGIRHHGPGSARNVKAALEELQPDIILIEGPPEGEALLQWALHEDMQPPVALLVYRPDNPQDAVFYPFAEYSPEWQAIRYGLQHQIPVRFSDIPLAPEFALKEAEAQAEQTSTSNAATTTEDTLETAGEELYKNPIRYLAEAAGYTDAEVWWEQQFELRKSSLQTFEALAEAMQALRDNLPLKEERREQIREAFMRKAIRTAQKEKWEQIAVICGAWHVPALQNMPTQKADDELLKGLPKVKADATWIPWTNSRLSFDSGYGAGINSPGWYTHLWEKPEDDGTHWLIHVARIFREQRMDISSAHVIETVRLAHSLAGMRQLHRAGLHELNEAVQAVMCMGDEVLLQLVWRELIVGHKTGNTPAEAPQVPLQKDLELWQKKLRLKTQDSPKLLQLDLREESGLQKSILLHRLLLLEVAWGSKRQAGGKGTFKEEWELYWKPELSINLLEKAAWGNTIEEAASAWLAHQSTKAQELSQLTALLENALPAELPAGVSQLMLRMDRLAAGTSDVAELMRAFLPLAQVRRYGNVRNTNTDTIALIMDSLLARIVAGLPPACSGIDEETGEHMAVAIRQMNGAILLLEEEEYRQMWYEALQKVLNSHQANALICGNCCKILNDAQVFDAHSTALEFSKALSRGTDPAYSSLWLEGFLKGSATTLILDNRIWQIVDDWLGELPAELFQEVVPVLRRTFSEYNNTEKRKLAEKAKTGGATTLGTANSDDLDEERARKILPLFYKLIGV